MANPTNPKDLLTSRDVARVLGLSVTTVRLAADDGRLPAMRTVGGNRVFRRDDVERLAQKVARAGKRAPADDHAPRE